MTYLTAEGKCTIYSEEESLAQAFIRYTNLELNDIKHKFIKIGFRLDEANRNKYYKELGYESITELAEKEFEFKSTVTYNLMQIWRFAHNKEMPMEIDKRFDKYSQTQLLEMSRSRHDLSNYRLAAIILEKATKEEIRKIIKEWNRWESVSNVSNDEFLKVLQAPPLLIESTAEQEPEEENFHPGGNLTESELQKRPEAEIIRVGLTGVDIYVKDAKFQICDTYKNYGPLEGNFERYIKSVYNYDNKSKFTHGFYSKEDNMNRTYDDAGVQFISFDPHQTVRLTWEEVAQHISELISKNEYLTASEQEEYSKWKAKDKSAEISDKEYDRLMEDLDGLIAGKPQLSDDELSVYCLKLGTGYQYGKFRLYDKVKDGDFTTSEFIDFVKKEYGGIYMGGADNFHKSIEATSRGLEITRLSGGALILSWYTVAGRIKRLIESGEYLSAVELERYAEWKTPAPSQVISYETSDGCEYISPAPVVGKTAMQSVAELTPRRRTRRQYLSELPDEEFVTSLLLQIAKVYPLKGDSAALISSMRKRLIEWLNQPQEV